MAVINLNINDALSIQTGAVVSRELIKVNGGTVTLFAFAKGEGLSDHQTPFQALITVISGSLEFTVLGKTYELNPHDSVVMPPLSPHSLKALEDTKMLLVMLKTAILD